MTAGRAAPGVGYTEALLQFGPEDGLVGTLARPIGGIRSKDSEEVAGIGCVALVVFNAGLIPRIGPHRLYVKLARAFAADGYPAFRFDLSGQGDSAAATTATGFEAQALDDLRTAMDVLERCAGISRFVVFGICSGAVLGYAAARTDPRIVGCAMFDPYMYPTLRTHVIRVATLVRRQGLWRTAAGWMRRRLIPASGRDADGQRPAAGGVSLGIVDPPRAEFAAGLASLLDRGVQLLMMYSGSALYQYNYPRQFDDGFRRFGLAGRIRADFLPDIDHTVTRLDAQDALIERLLDWTRERFPVRQHRAINPGDVRSART